MLLNSFFFLGVLTACLSFELELSVPNVVVEERDGSVTLDCKYNLENEDGLVVKWFFKDRKNLIYQWIKGLEPSVIGYFRKKIDREYNPTNSSKPTHRALHIKDPDISMSGEYTCVVSTYKEEESKSKNMTVISNGVGPHLRYSADPDDSEKVRFSCDSYDVHPIPELNIITDGVKLENQTITAVTAANSRFNVSKTVAVYAENLKEGQQVFCRQVIPQLEDYYKESSLVYVPGAHGDSMPTAQLAAVGASSHLGSASLSKLSVILLASLGIINFLKFTCLL